MSSPHSHDEEGKGYSPHMRGVALGILVMGVSLAAVIILWTTIGYIGPDFSTQVMERQQAWLHEQYGLPPVQELSPEMLEVPPSLRGVTAATSAAAGGANATNQTGGANATTTAAGGANATNQTGGANATTTAAAGGANATTTAAAGGAPMSNATTTGTTGNATGTGATGGEGGGGGTSVSIVPGSSSLTTDAFQPNPIQVGVGDTVTWTNDDAQPHTATSGQNATPDGRFDSGIMAPGATFDFTFTEAGEYPYFCLLHPNMVGTVSVSS
jgi:plastocyanin